VGEFFPRRQSTWSCSDLARWARAYLEHINAPDEMWKVVFPGRGTHAWRRAIKAGYERWKSENSAGAA
jgi:hypothetical protein